MSADPTADAGIDIGQRWRQRSTGDRFTVLRTYRDNPINPSFLIEWESSPGWHNQGKATVMLGFFHAYCERADSTELASTLSCETSTKGGGDGVA